MSHLNLTPDRWLTDGYDDPGIFHTPGKPGKESRTRHQSKNQCFDPPVVAFRSPEEIPPAGYLARDRQSHDYGPALPAHERSFPRLFTFYFFSLIVIDRHGNTLRLDIFQVTLRGAMMA